jgi:hypothetical protein
LHVADGGDGTAEAPGAKAEEVAEHASQPAIWLALVGGLLRLGRRGGRVGGSGLGAGRADRAPDGGWPGWSC